MMIVRRNVGTPTSSESFVVEKFDHHTSTTKDFENVPLDPKIYS